MGCRGKCAINENNHIQRNAAGNQPFADTEKQVPDYEIPDGDHLQKVWDNDVLCRIRRY